MSRKRADGNPLFSCQPLLFCGTASFGEKSNGGAIGGYYFREGLENGDRGGGEDEGAKLTISTVAADSHEVGFFPDLVIESLGKVVHG